MNIQEVKLGAHRLNHLRNGSVNGSEIIDVQSSHSAVEEGSASGTEDRVEISADARAALSQQRTTQEMQFSRKALLSIPSLSKERSAEILQRIRDGYYSQPDILKEIAEHVADELAGKPKDV